MLDFQKLIEFKMTELNGEDKITQLDTGQGYNSEFLPVIHSPSFQEGPQRNGSHRHVPNRAGGDSSEYNSNRFQQNPHVTPPRKHQNNRDSFPVVGIGSLMEQSPGRNRTQPQPRQLQSRKRSKSNQLDRRSPSMKPGLELLDERNQLVEGSATDNPDAEREIDSNVDYMCNVIKSLTNHIKENHSRIEDVGKALNSLREEFRQNQENSVARGTSSSRSLVELAGEVDILKEKQKRSEEQIESQLNYLQTQMNVQSESHESLLSAVEEINDSVERFADTMENAALNNSSDMTQVTEELSKLRSMVRGTDNTEGTRNTIQRLRSFKSMQSMAAAGEPRPGSGIPATPRSSSELVNMIKYLDKRVLALEQKPRKFQMADVTAIPEDQPQNLGLDNDWGADAHVEVEVDSSDSPEESVSTQTATETAPPQSSSIAISGTKDNGSAVSLISANATTVDASSSTSSTVTPTPHPPASTGPSSAFTSPNSAVHGSHGGRRMVKKS